MPVLLCRLRAAEAARGRVLLRVALAGGSEEELFANHVITGTGYRPALDHLPAPEAR